jgi:DNA-binding transcriptional LysR family regulator
VELRHLRYFVAVAEELHFGRAATRLHISQPPLSHQIQDLERELGVELLRRNRRSVALTEAGRLFLEEARQVLGDAQHAVEIAHKAGRGEVGRLSIGCGPAPQSWILERVLSVFLARHPDVRIELHSLYTQDQVDALGARRIQIAFPLLPIPHRGLVVERIGEERLVVALPVGHRLASADSISLVDLRNEPFVTVSREVGPSFYDLVLRACGEAGFIPTIAHEASRVVPVLGFVAAGLGISLQPEGVGSGHQEGVVFRALPPRTPAIQIGIAYRRDDSSPALSAFLDVVREVAAQRRPRPIWAPPRLRARPTPGEIRVFPTKTRRSR